MSGIRGVKFVDDDGNVVATGGLRAAMTNKSKDPDFYRKIGSIGGSRGHTGGFAANPALARIAGAKGGRISKRGPAKKKKTEE